MNIILLFDILVQCVHSGMPGAHSAVIYTFAYEQTFLICLGNSCLSHYRLPNLLIMFSIQNITIIKNVT